MLSPVRVLESVDQVSILVVKMLRLSVGDRLGCAIVQQRAEVFHPEVVAAGVVGSSVPMSTNKVENASLWRRSEFEANPRSVPDPLKNRGRIPLGNRGSTGIRVCSDSVAPANPSPVDGRGFFEVTLRVAPGEEGRDPRTDELMAF